MRLRIPARPLARPYWLIALFAIYGPSVNVLGELRYVEAAVLVLLFLNIGRAVSCLGAWEKRLVMLFLLASVAHVVSDMVNDASVDGTLKRSATYALLAFLVVALKWLSRGDELRLKFIVQGYCLSYVFILFAGSFNEGYNDQPWRLGLGTAATVSLCLSFLWFPRLARFAWVGLFAMAWAHAVLLARSLAGVTAIVAILALIATLRGQRAPILFRPGLIIGSGIAALALVATMYLGAKEVTDARLWPEQLQVIMEQQLSNPYGLLAAGRPDVVTAVYAVWKRPLLGHGTTNVDPDVYALYIDLVAASDDWVNYVGWFNELAQRTVGTPSHSHLFGAWADAGILAALVWIDMLVLCAYVASRTMLWRDPRAPLFLFVALFTTWDLLFSPGPERMDMAIRITILVYAAKLLKAFDAKRIRATPGYAHRDHCAFPFHKKTL